jgi:S1-C subfamily serine protease
LAALILTVVPVAALAQEEAITKNTEPSTVRILGHVGNGQWAGGSGFVVASRYVATNWHVVAGMQSNPMVILGQGAKVDAQVVARDQQKGLAVLELEGESGKPPVRFSPMEFAKKTA